MRFAVLVMCGVLEMFEVLMRFAVLVICVGILEMFEV